MRHKLSYTRLALVFSILILLAWSLMGTGVSLAWFSDSDVEVKNVFHFATFDVLAEYRQKDGNWKDITGETKIFDDQALYEPGYVQVVYLRVTNNGTVPFDYYTAVNVTDYTPAMNVFGQMFNLQDYLEFGLTPAVGTEAEMDALVATRPQARAYANMPLNNYDTEVASLDAGQSAYMALVVRMPEEVGNVANYRGNTIPRVELGLIVSATQQDS